ncbi:MAG TPA: GNAT family N-acetyltransferase [Motilibacterales bacterium]|nr:GNAT family N-acetyltransferase [Motilibacterales bacterium]
MVIVGLFILLAVIGVGMSGLWARESQLVLGQGFNVLGMQLSAPTIGQMFRAGPGRILPTSGNTGLLDRGRLTTPTAPPQPRHGVVTMNPTQVDDARGVSHPEDDVVTQEARVYWRILIDVPDRPGGVDTFIRALAALNGYMVAMYVVGASEGSRTLDMRLTAPESVYEETLLAAALTAGRNARISPGSPDDAVDLPTRILNASAELVKNPGWAPYAAKQLVGADQVEVVVATKGQNDGPDVLRLQWTPEFHVLLRRRWAPFTRVEQARASAALRLAAAIAVASGDADALGWVEPVKDGTVWIRLAHPEDAKAVGEMHRRCSDRTLYLRYVSCGVWPEIQLRRLSGGHSGATLVAVDEDNTIIGLGNVFPECAGAEDCAELAVLVEDSHQGEGVGTALLRRQLQVAEQMGFSEVEAMVLTENRAMTRMLQRTNLAWTTKVEQGSATMHAPLAATGSAPDEPLKPGHRDHAKRWPGARASHGVRDGGTRRGP